MPLLVVPRLKCLLLLAALGLPGLALAGAMRLPVLLQQPLLPLPLLLLLALALRLLPLLLLLLALALCLLPRRLLRGRCLLALPPPLLLLQLPNLAAQALDILIQVDRLRLLALAHLLPRQQARRWRRRVRVLPRLQPVGRVVAIDAGAAQQLRGRGRPPVLLCLLVRQLALRPLNLALQPLPLLVREEEHGGGQRHVYRATRQHLLPRGGPVGQRRWPRLAGRKPLRRQRILYQAARRRRQRPRLPLAAAGGAAVAAAFGSERLLPGIGLR